MIKIPQHFNLDSIINVCEQPTELKDDLGKSIIKRNNTFKPHIDNECKKIKKSQEESIHNRKNGLANDNIFNTIDVMKYLGENKKEKIFK